MDGRTVKHLALAKKQRLTTNAQFRAVIGRRRRASDALLTVYMAPNAGVSARLGVSVGRSCGGAVRRNRFKRLIREAFRLCQHRIPLDFDYVVMVSRRGPGPTGASLHTIAQSLEGLIASLARDWQVTAGGPG